MSDAATRPCPICRKGAALPAENRWFPFCSDRCKALDLSKWINEEYRIPGDDADDGERGSEPGPARTLH